MKVSYMAGDGKDFRGLAWFCSTSCLGKWKQRMGEAGLEALLAITVAVAKHKKAKRVGDSDDKSKGKATGMIDEDIERAWRTAVEKPARKDIRLIDEEDDENTLFFFLDGLIARYNSAQEWSKFLSLNPSLKPYDDKPSLLASHIRIYDFLRVHLPQSSGISQFCTPETIFALFTRDFGNSFGIWEDIECEDGEMLGYGCWVEASFFNHSCENNLKKRVRGRVFHFYTSEDVENAGEQLTINYIGEEKDAPLVKRRAQLQKGWGFCCQCPKCSRDEAAGL